MWNVPPPLTPQFALVPLSQHLFSTLPLAFPDHAHLLETPCVHKGFLAAFDSLADALTEALKAVLKSNPTPSLIVFTGHSMGGALAHLAALCFRVHEAEFFINSPPPPVHVYSFGAPRLGGRQFARLYELALPNSFRSGLASPTPHRAGSLPMATLFRLFSPPPPPLLTC
jgi:pimeloyl-ACP methyl ester carboxylesterase